MGRGGMLEIAVPRLRKHLEEVGKALFILECAEFLGVSSSAAVGVLYFMEETGIVQRVKRGINFYFRKDTYDEERIETMLLEAVKRNKRENGHSRARSKYDPIIDSFLEGEDDLVRVDVVEKTPSYMASVLYGRIKARELGDRIESYISDKCLYLEKI